jgi:hypothetical protein
LQESPPTDGDRGDSGGEAGRGDAGKLEVVDEDGDEVGGMDACRPQGGMAKREDEPLPPRRPGTKQMVVRRPRERMVMLPD